MDEIFLCLLHGFRDGHRYFRRFALANADPSLSVTHNDERAEIEALAALDNFGNAVDKHDLVLKAQFVWIDSHAFLLLSFSYQLSALSSGSETDC
jgi:hypothetical protein